MSDLGFEVDPLDPRAPAQDVWDALSEAERRHVVASLPTEIERAEPPEGDAHRVPKSRALDTLSEHYRRTRKRIYLSSELPVYYPGERMFAPDLIAVLDVEPRERNSWVVSQEGRGLDLALEIHVAGSPKKDFEDNVDHFAQLGIPEYFAFDVPRNRLLGFRLPEPEAKRYEVIVPQEGRWPSRVLDLDLALSSGRLRFFQGAAVLLDAQELIAQLSSMVDEAMARAEDEAKRARDEAKRAEDEAKRAEDEAKRAEDEAKRAERLAARLRELGVDPDET